MEFEVKSELVAVDDMKGGLVLHDAVLEERRIDGGQDVPRGGAAKDTRSLYEQIAATRQAADDFKKQGESQAFKPRGLDEEEADFLSQQHDSEQRRAYAVVTQETIDRRTFELALTNRNSSAGISKTVISGLSPGAVFKPSAAIFRPGGVAAPSSAPLAGSKHPREGPADAGPAAGSMLTTRNAESLHSTTELPNNVNVRKEAEPTNQSPITGDLAANPARIASAKNTGILAKPRVAQAAHAASRATKSVAAAPQAGLVDYFSSDDEEDDA